MPKELIYSQDADAAETAESMAGVVVEHLAIVWMKEADLVQIGIVQGPAADVVIDGEKVPEGLWMSLDRKRINDLIRYLRRARDSAYGADA